MTPYNQKFLVTTVLPHSGKMVLLDSILSVDTVSLDAEVKITRESLFYCREPGGQHGAFGVPAWVGVEYMAQSVAAWAGVQSRLKSEAPRIGFLVGVKTFTTNVSFFSLGSHLRTHVTLSYQDSQLAAFQCQITGAGIDVDAMLNLYQPDELEYF